jgi:acyl carrier protein
MNRSNFMKSVGIALLSSQGLELWAQPKEKISLKKIMKAFEVKYICESPSKALTTCLFTKKTFGWDKYLTKELGLDSLDTVEFIMQLEKDFDISIKDEDAAEVQTPRQAAILVHRYVNAK